MTPVARSSSRIISLHEVIHS